jgi:hypothetical protein
VPGFAERGLPSSGAAARRRSGAPRAGLCLGRPARRVRAVLGREVPVITGCLSGTRMLASPRVQPAARAFASMSSLLSLRGSRAADLALTRANIFHTFGVHEEDASD